MSERICSECPTPLTGRQRFTCGPTCRAARSRRTTGKDTRTSGKGKVLRSVATRPSARSGKRADTLYAVLIEDDKLRKRWRELGTLAANKREKAEARMRSNLGLDDDAVLRAVPVTSLYPASR